MGAQLTIAILGPIIVSIFFPHFTYSGHLSIGWWVTAGILFVAQAIIYGTGHGYIRSVQIRASGPQGWQLADPAVQDVLDKRFRWLNPLIYVGLYAGLRMASWLPIVLIVIGGFAGGCIHMFMGDSKLRAFTLLAYYGNAVSIPLLSVAYIASMSF